MINKLKKDQLVRNPKKSINEIKLNSTINLNKSISENKKLN